MSKLPLCFAILLLCFAPLAQADLIPPDQAQAESRLRANPKLFDRYDSFCAGKSAGDPCVIPGSALEGGGNGICRNEVASRSSVIDLSCRRTGSVSIDRRLPAGGFVNDATLCRAKASAVTEDERRETQRWNCTPPSAPLADRFCEGKAAGERCSVELSYQGKQERNDGICKRVVETESFYWQGRREASRVVTRCEPEQTVTHEYKPASWFQKLMQ